MAVRTRKSHAVMSAPSGGGGGLLSILGGLMGAGGITGGTFSPGTDPEPKIQNDIKTSGADLSDEDQSIDTNNAVRRIYKDRGVVASPPSFSPAQASNPMMDMIFNKGGAGQLATKLNMQNNMAMADMAMKQQLATQAQQNALAQTALQNQGQIEGIEAGGNQARLTGNATHDNSIRSINGLSSLSPANQFDVVRSAIGGNQEAAKLAATQAPTYAGDVAANTRAMNQAAQAENFAKTKVSSAPGERVMGAFGMSGNEPGRLYNFPGSDVSHQLMPEYFVSPDGKTKIQTGTKDVQSVVPRSGGYQDELEAKRNAMLKVAEGGSGTTTAPTTSPKATPSKVKATPTADNSVNMFEDIDWGAALPFLNGIMGAGSTPAPAEDMSQLDLTTQRDIQQNPALLQQLLKRRNKVQPVPAIPMY